MCDQIVQFSRTECFAGISWEGLTRDMLAKPTCHHLYWLLTFQLCASHMLPFRGMLSREIPAKNLLDWLLAFQSCAGHMFLFSGCLVARYLRKPFWLQMLKSSHSLSQSHNPYNKFPQQIPGIQDWINYNQIWHGTKANTIHICKLLLYNS